MAPVFFYIATRMCSNCLADSTKQRRTREKNLGIITEFFKQEKTVSKEQ